MYPLRVVTYLMQKGKNLVGRVPCDRMVLLDAIAQAICVVPLCPR